KTFALAEAMQQHETGGDYSCKIAVYVDTHLEFPYLAGSGLFISTSQLEAQLAKTIAHEAAHTFGLLHTAHHELGPVIRNTKFTLYIACPADTTDKFQLIFNGAITAKLARNATPAQILFALENLS